MKTHAPTLDMAGFGEPGYTSHRLANVGSLINALCPTSGTFYLGIGDYQAVRSDLSSAPNTNWIRLPGKKGSEFVDMFDSFPTAGQFTGSSNAVECGPSGTSCGPYSFRTTHPTYGSEEVVQFGKSSSYNSQILFEYCWASASTSTHFIQSDSSSGCGHSWTVWQNGAGTYEQQSRPGSLDRYAWLGVTGTVQL